VSSGVPAVKFSRTRHYWLLRNAVKELMPRQFVEHGPVEHDPDLENAEHVQLEWPAHVRKPSVGLVRDIDNYPYWTKYARFLRWNEIPFDIYDIHCSHWFRVAQRYDMVLWRPMSFPFELEECRRKFHLLERELGLVCYPSFAEAQVYEDKIAQSELLRHHGFPVIDTFVSNSEQEALAYVAAAEYPLVWKLTTGSGSLGVELVRSRRDAERLIRQVFGFAGRRTYWPYTRQKNYVYLQPLVAGARYDLRVVVAGSLMFGYYRDVPSGEFRASGMHTERYDLPSSAAVRMARRVATALSMPCLAVDFIEDTRSGDLKIIELSLFVEVRDLADQLGKDGVSGALVLDAEGEEYVFRPMLVWMHEAVLKEVMETRWIARETHRLHDQAGNPPSRER
jgi:glutathione synthase/RimK-type ligase-like ATP-grasp enzyme